MSASSQRGAAGCVCVCVCVCWPPARPSAYAPLSAFFPNARFIAATRELQALVEEKYREHCGGSATAARRHVIDEGEDGDTDEMDNDRGDDHGAAAAAAAAADQDDADDDDENDEEMTPSSRAKLSSEARLDGRKKDALLGVFQRLAAEEDLAPYMLQPEFESDEARDAFVNAGGRVSSLQATLDDIEADKYDTVGAAMSDVVAVLTSRMLLHDCTDKAHLEAER